MNNKKCPYAVNRQIVTQTKMEYNDEGQQTSWQEVQNNAAVFVNCLGEQCGAFNESTGKCEYRGAQ